MELGLKLSDLNNGYGINEGQHGADNGGGNELHILDELDVVLCWFAGVWLASGVTGGHPK